MRQGMVLLAWLAMTTFASAQFAVEKYLDDQSFLVARIRPQKVEMNKAIAFLTKAKVIPQAEAFAIGLSRLPSTAMLKKFLLFTA